MVRTRPTLPAGHGEVLERPAFAEWAALLESNRSAARAWDFCVAGRPALELRDLARREALTAGEAYCSRLGIPVHASRLAAAAADPGSSAIIATGHQPELYHPGVWIKDFLVQRLSEQTGALGLDVVVDTDGFETVELVSPCLAPDVQRCRAYLAIGTSGGTYAGTPVPSPSDLVDWCAAADANLATLPAPAVRRHFAAFCQGLSDVAADAENVAELVTAARRRYEASAGTDYLEYPVSSFDTAFACLVVHAALDAEAFSMAYNGALAEYRSLHGTRSVAQPFPDLEVGAGRIELPFWVLRNLNRTTLWAEPLAGGGATLYAADEPIVELPADPAMAAELLATLAGVGVAPKAVTLTMYVRLFLSDLFVHGVGGGRYDQVTDEVIRRYFGIEPPRFVVASMTMYLPLGVHIVTDEEVARARERVNRLARNPDEALDEVDFESPEERVRARGLADEKARLILAIAEDGADKKVLGGRIRSVNEELSALLAPFAVELRNELAALESQAVAAEIMTDRSYPFCFWAPEEVADKAW